VFFGKLSILILVLKSLIAEPLQISLFSNSHASLNFFTSISIWSMEYSLFDFFFFFIAFKYSDVAAGGAEGAVFAVLLVGDGDEIGTEENVADEDVEVTAEAADLLGAFLR